MSAEIDLKGVVDHIPDVPQPLAGPSVPDHLREIRATKRWVQAGVYLAILGYGPLYLFVLGYQPHQVAISWAVGFTIATLAIERAFGQIFKLRKRSAYPGAVSLQLGAMPTFDAACQTAVAVMDRLLDLRGSFLALEKEGGFLSLVALSNLSRVDADRYLRLGTACVQHTLSSKEVVALHPDGGLGAEPIMTPGQQIVFVPIHSFQKVVGVLGLIANSSNPDLNDSELLVSLGHAVGASLESLRQRDELRTLASIDDLTKVYNRRYFFDQLDREFAAAGRYSTPVSVLIFDVDGLKNLNDNFGHGVGDEALRTLAQRLVRYARASDIVARLGGDEFAVILPHTDHAGAADIARRLQVSVEREALAAVPGRELRIAVSCGFASFPEDAEDASVLLRRADGRLYAAKAARQRATRRRRS